MNRVVWGGEPKEPIQDAKEKTANKEIKIKSRRRTGRSQKRTCKRKLFNLANFKKMNTVKKQ